MSDDGRVVFINVDKDAALRQVRELAPGGLVERMCGWLAGRLLLVAARRANERGATHEFSHIMAAVRAGNTGPGSHNHGCVARKVLNQ